MIDFFDIKNIAFTCLGYSISYTELIGTLMGLVSVYYASKESILTWPTGILNELFLFVLFFQIQLYADMVLQIFFFVATIFGWYTWRRKISPVVITTLNISRRLTIGFVIIVFTIAAGFLFKNIHLLLPRLFEKEAAYPFVDSFVMTLSIFATIFLAKKKIENWFLWLLVDFISIVLFVKKEIYFLALEYVIFLVLASYGLYNWKKEYNHD